MLLFRSRYLRAGDALAALLPRVFPAGARSAIVEKDRRRWLVAYRGVEFYVHLDRLIDAADRRATSSRSSRGPGRGATREDKAAVIAELLALFGASPDDTISDGYVELAAS